MCEPDFLGRQAATGYQAANIGNIGRYDVIAAPGGKPPPVAGAAQCGDRDVGVVGAKGVAEGQREKQAEWRTALRLRVEQAGEEHRFRCRLSPPDGLAGTDQLGKIERFGRYGDRGFHAPLRGAISEEVETRGASSGHSSAPPRTQHHAGREYAPSLRQSFICLSRPGPVTLPRYAPLPVRGSVHLSRQFPREADRQCHHQGRPEGGSLRSGNRLAVACGFTPRSLRGVAAGAEPEVRIHLTPAESRANLRQASAHSNANG